MEEENERMDARELRNLADNVSSLNTTMARFEVNFTHAAEIIKQQVNGLVQVDNRVTHAENRIQRVEDRHDWTEKKLIERKIEFDIKHAALEKKMECQFAAQEKYVGEQKIEMIQNQMTATERQNTQIAGNRWLIGFMITLFSLLLAAASLVLKGMGKL